MIHSDGRQSTVERAIQIAREDAVTSVKEIRDQLRAEGYSSVDVSTEGASIKAQLHRLILDRSAARDREATEESGKGRDEASRSYDSAPADAGAQRGATSGNER